MLMLDETLERTGADAELTRRRYDRRRAEDRSPEIGERRTIARRKAPGLMGLVNVLLGRN